MATAMIEVGSFIEHRADKGGRPYVRAKGVSVARIGGLWLEGLSPEEMVRDVFDGVVSLAEVHAALAVYDANREAIDADVAAQNAEYDRHATDHPSVALGREGQLLLR